VTENKPSVLIVEDDADIRETLNAILQQRDTIQIRQETEKKLYENLEINSSKWPC